MRSRVARRIVLALLLAALLPLGAAVVLALGLTEVSLGVGLNQTVQRGLSNDIPLYQALFDTKKALYKQSAAGLALDPELQAALDKSLEINLLRPLLARWLEQAPDLTAVSLTREGSVVEAHRTPSPGSRPLSLTRRVLGHDDVELQLVYHLPGRHVRGLQEARELAETYQVLAAARDAITRGMLLTFATVLLVVLIGAVFVGVLLARGVTVRVARLAAATSRVADGDLAAQVDVTGNDELAELAGAFNTMVVELAERRDRIVYLEKISGWQEVARRLAHEIKNPLTPIVLAVQQIDEKRPQADQVYGKLVTTAREIIEEEVAALRRLVEEFSAFAKLPEVRPEPVDFASYLQEIATQLQTTTPHAELDIDIAEDLGQVEIDRMMMRRVISNLVQNAAEAQIDKPEGARIRLQARREGARAVLRVEDAGPGIDPAIGQRVFEPYVTGKQQGTGLGLAIVKKIVLQHGARIVADQAPELGGARFEIWFRCDDNPRQLAAPTNKR